MCLKDVLITLGQFGCSGIEQGFSVVAVEALGVGYPNPKTIKTL